jgi:hypothetical protein
MKKLNFGEPEKLEVTVQGKINNLTYPAWGTVEEMEAKGEDLKPSDIKDFLNNCGLSQESFQLLTFKQVQDIYTELLGLKKN